MATIKEVTDAAAIISYMGEVVSAPKAGQTKRLKIKGKYMDDDILVEAAEQVITLQEKTVTPTKSAQEVTADEGNDGLSKVTVEAIPSEYVVPSGTLSITENGPHDVTNYANVEVEVEGGGIDGGYTVTFMSNNTTYASLSILQGGSVNAPSNPTVEGATFLGWYTGEGGTGSAISFPYTPSSDITLYADFYESIVLGFTGLTNESGELTLTDDVAGFAKYTTSESGAYVNVSNPLDSVFPYNQIEEFTDDSENVFVKFPKFWMKWVVNDSGEIDGWKISDTQADEDYFIPDCFLNSDGATYNDYFALGKYEASGSSSKMYSKSGATCLLNIAKKNARTAARAYGSSDNYYNGYQLEDMSMLTAYNFLCMMYYQTANIQTVYGGRTGSGSSWDSASATGTCDALSGMNGWSTTTDCVKMLGIENPYGNIFKWIDGIYFSSSTVYIHRLPQNFADSTSLGLKLGVSRPESNGYISALKSGTATGTRSCVYASAVSGSKSTYCGDYCEYISSGAVLCVGGYWNAPSSAGLWCLNGFFGSSYGYTQIGARLAYRPVSA